MRPESYRVRRNNAKLGLLRRSRSFKVTEFGTNRKLICNFLLVINSNLHHILHRFRDNYSLRIDKSKTKSLYFGLYLATPLAFNSRTEGLPSDYLGKILPGCQWMAMVPNCAETLPKISTG